MRLISKIKIFGTLVGLLAIFAAFQIATGNILRDRENDDNLMLSVEWDPGVLSIQNPVRIVVTVDGFAIATRPRHVSPYSETMTVARGALVVLSASTAHPNVQFMDCIILVNGLIVPGTGFDSVKGPGSVTCSVQTKVI